MTELPELPADWRVLVDIGLAFDEADDATDLVIIERLDASVSYKQVLSKHQAWKNKYDRCAQRGLILVPYRIRRRQDGDSYIIEATRDLTPLIEQAMVDWGETGEPYGNQTQDD